MLKQLLKVCVMLGGILSVVACSDHQNPLRQADPKAAADFLYESARYAERKLNIPHYVMGEAYGDCMQQKLNQKTCRAVFMWMLTYAKDQKNPTFQRVTLSHLKDKTMYQTLKAEYENSCLVESGD